jgi:hypothetical protein
VSLARPLLICRIEQIAQGVSVEPRIVPYQVSEAWVVS